jgi:hypothetical protein
MHKDIGRYVDYGVTCITPASFNQGSSMTNTSGNTTGQSNALTGPVIDRLALPRMYRSCILSFPVEAKVPATFTASLAFKLQDAPASSGPFADYTSGTQASPGVTIGSTSTTAQVVIDAGGGTTQNNMQALAQSADVFRLAVDLGAARRYLQVVAIPQLQSSSSGGGDYLAVAGKLEFGGTEELASTS